MNAQQIIEHLNLEPLPEEGGYFRRTYETAERIDIAALPPRYRETTAHPQELLLGTAIYALFTATDFSAMHRLNSDEIYHFYYGDPLELLLLHPDGSGETIVLGTDFATGMTPQVVVPQDAWQGSIIRAGGAHGFSLIGTTMAPGFEWSSFELGERAALIEQYPDFATRINARTR